MKMTILSIINSCIAVLFFFSVPAFANEQVQEEKYPSDFAIQAKMVIPDKPAHYTLPEMIPIFHPILEQTTVLKIFDECFEVLFPPDKDSLPHHPPKTVTGSWRCLWGKLMAANTHTQAEDVIDLQKKAIYQLMFLHRELFRRANSSLIDTIDQYEACALCVTEATKDETHGNDSY
jgi:hypothetical protein